MTWVALREEVGWTLTELETGTQIRPQRSGGMRWVERVTVQDREHLDDDHGPNWWSLHTPHRLTDATNDQDAERTVLLFARALGAHILTDHTGAFLDTDWTGDLLRSE